MRIAVLDGQGGGIGKSLVEKLKGTLPDTASVWAMGTNPAAAQAMQKAGADKTFCTQHEIVNALAQADAIVGGVGIVVAGAMKGELTAPIANAVSASPALKVLIPLNRCNIRVAGTKGTPLSAYIEDAVNLLYKLAQGKNSDGPGPIAICFGTCPAKWQETAHFFWSGCE